MTDSDGAADGGVRNARREVFLSFLKLGLTAFGGPVAHLGYFQAEFVERRRWLTDRVYADLVALCQFLPGPASSQVGFAVGYLRGGLLAGVLGWLAFTLPSAVIMIACAYGLRYVDATASWIHGLKIAAVAVVAQAILGMAAQLCPDGKRMTIAIGVACFLLFAGNALLQVVAIAVGMLVGCLLFKGADEATPAGATADGEGAGRAIHHGGLPRACLLLFFTLLLALPLLATAWPDRWLALTDSFYRSGSLVFGGGHVILPLLESATVGRGWVDSDVFLAGYGIAQALPGPLFTFAAYLGVFAAPDGIGWLGGVVCLLAVLLPSLLLVVGVLPHWDRLRSNPTAKAALMGANAAVVGLLIAAFYDPIWISAIRSPQAFALALVAFFLLYFRRIPPWALVILCGAAGQLLL